ncbi:MAG: cytochrome c oxidase subunit 3 [Salibacteraceae bacterium]
MAGIATQQLTTKELWAGKRSPFSISYGKMMMWFFLISDALTFTGFLSALAFMRVFFADVWPITENIFYHFPFFHHTELPLLYVAFMTFILIISSVTMVLAVEAGHRMDKKGVTKWLFLTVIGGAIFLGSQAWEWSTFIKGSDHGALDMGDGTMARILNEEGTFEYHGAAYDGFVIQKRNGDIIQGAEALDLKATQRVVQGANLIENEYGLPLYADFFFFITGFHGTHVLSGVIINLLILLRVRKGEFEKTGHYEMVEKVGLYWHFIDLVWVFVFTFFYLV